MKLKFIKVLGLMAALSTGSALAATDPAGGDIWQIVPCDRNGTELSTPVSSIDETIPAGSNQYFKVRLVARKGGTRWAITATPGSSVTSSMVNPLGIGIYVSGRLTYAYYVGDLAVGKHFTDVVFGYTPKPGDFALPIKLATANGPADDEGVEGLPYALDPFGKWNFTSTDADGTAVDCNWWFFMGDDSMERLEADAQPTRDFSLKVAGFYLKTIDFASDWEVSGDLWRSVHEGSTVTTGSQPALAAVSGPEEFTTLYVWSTNENAVILTGDNVKEVTMRIGGKASKPVTATYHVATVTFARGQLTSNFDIQGVTEGETSALVLSASDHFNFSTATEMREDDFITVPVACIEALPPSIVIKPSKSTVTATSDYLESVGELSIRFTQAFTEDVTFTVKPVFEDGTDAALWIDYLRVSDEKPLSSLAGATNLTFTIPAGSLVPQQDGVEVKTFLYALRSDEHVTGAASHLQFVAVTENEAAKAAIGDWDLPQGDLNIDAEDPVIALPVEGESSWTAVKGISRSMRIKVEDTYADQISEDGYKILVLYNSDRDTEFTTLSGFYKPDAKGYLVDTATGAYPVGNWSVVGDNKTIIKVQSPVGNYARESEERNVTVTVSEPAGVVIDVADGETYEYTEDDGEHGGGAVEIHITLTEKNQTGKPLYAFLAPATDHDRNAVDCGFLAADNCRGLEIGDGGDTVVGFFTLIDGGSTMATSQFSYGVVLRDAPVWQDGETVTSYIGNNTLVLKSKNVVPVITGAQMGLNETGDDHTFDGVVIPLGIEQDFAAILDEPGLADLRATGDDAFQIKWSFKADGQSAQSASNADANGIIRGNPTEDDAHAKFTFTSAGTWTITVQPKDKDMTKFGEKYVFYVQVVDQPLISITGRYGSGKATDEVRTSFKENESVDETDADDYAWLNIALDYNKCGFPMTVALEVVPPSTSAEDNPGQFVLQENQQVKKIDDYHYEITFRAGVTEVPVSLKTLDGTPLSRSEGWTLVAAVTTHQIVPDSGNRYADEYYIADPSTRPIKVQNVAPVVNEALLSPMPGTTNVCAIGAGDPISWDFSDVDPDFVKGLEVVIKGGGGDTRTVYTAAEAAGSFTPTFTASGLQTVQITFKDKDNGSVSYIWYYNVEVSKTMTIVPHGPALGYGYDYGKRYRSAAGLGEGRVWAKGISSTEEWKHLFNCEKSTDWQIFAYGYKVGDVEGEVFHYPDGRTGYYADRDIALNSNGSTKGVEGGYAYPDATRDSFFYTWIQIVPGESGQTATDALLTGTCAPEYTENPDVGTLVTLPTELSDNGTYVQTKLEAIFAKEYLPSDNMGDINQDGIPDIFVTKYALASASQDATDDLERLATKNEDVDYLPAELTATMAKLIPGLAGTWVDSGRPFNATAEIRGYGEALNDATAQYFPDGTPNPCAVVGVKPDRQYTNPEEDELSTLTLVEYYAWTEFAAANALDPDDEANWIKWSPERPSDPTVADTDGDGFTDGYEYFFWYRAHVGYLDDKGQHCRLTGRAYNPRNPAEGTVIPASVIESIMDPIVVSADEAEAETRDTDNDGIIDLLEFELGTNPFDFDTDGDGLADGWELLVAGTDPLLAYTTPGVLDTLRNYDGDAMAYTTPALETLVMPTPIKIELLTSLAVLDEDGDSDGIQWYAGESEKLSEKLALSTQPVSGWRFAADGVEYFSTEPVYMTKDGLLANSLERLATYVVTNTEEYGEVAVTPTALPAGIELDGAPAESRCQQLVLDAVPAAEDRICQAAWLYAADGTLALARYQVPQVGQTVVEIPSVERDVAYLHSLVYQKFGFDPRTAWKATSPLAARWGASIEGEAVSGDYYVKTQGGYTGRPTRTKAYTAYDEFVIYSFFLNNGVELSEESFISKDGTPRWATIWLALTTNPQGPNEPDLIDDEHYVGRASENGADTDGDGVPDGWELYIMAGPAADGYFNFAPPYAGFRNASFYFKGLIEEELMPQESYWSPFVAAAAKNETTYFGYFGENDKYADTLNELREFGGTDTIGYYDDYSSTIARYEGDAEWLNKFFPTDPWNYDTDGDSLYDDAEAAGVFIYGTPADDGKLKSIPGGGLNPCSIDTDIDGLPDPWELQYANEWSGYGNALTIYSGDYVSYAKDASGNAIGNPLQGLCRCPDGTVHDAYTYPVIFSRSEIDGAKAQPNLEYCTVDGVNQVVNRDYDFDGLDNWQEYLTGAMRCWRYDDPLSRWDSIPYENYWDIEIAEGKTNIIWNPKFDQLGVASEEEFWYKTMFDRTSELYNPFLIAGTASLGQYFTLVTNGWDAAYLDADLNSGKGGAWYFLYDRVGGVLLKDLWSPVLKEAGLGGGAPTQYMGCSPVSADSDRDGMDDYYELFHGLNPLLGKTGQQDNGQDPCDLVYTAFSSVEAWNDNGNGNFWLKDSSYNFVTYPWLNGSQGADPDGDDIRNVEEAVMPRLGTATAWHHTDPTPVWMTDSSYTNSLTSRFYLLPSRFQEVVPGVTNFTYTVQTEDGETEVECSLAGVNGWKDGKFGVFNPDQWGTVLKGRWRNWMYSFEENEGYDSDHDGIDDDSEIAGRLGDASDAQDAEGPHRRQAMYFKGDKSALQSMPYVREEFPILNRFYPQELAYLNYTVECWVRPDDLRNATIIERAIWSAQSNPADQEFLRRNFQLAVRDGRWFTKYDTAGTLADASGRGEVAVYSALPAEAGKWTHLAATYDGKRLALYVNGVLDAYKESERQPEYGTEILSLRPSYPLGDISYSSVVVYWLDHEYPLWAFLMGASFKGYQDLGGEFNEQLNVLNAAGWDRYKDFYAGYLDEVRVWDGARTGDEIAAAMMKRYTADDIQQNRVVTFNNYSSGIDRYGKTADGRAYDFVEPELRHHYSFDGIFGAENEASLATAPIGFDHGPKAPASRPEGYEIYWWKRILEGYEGAIYSNPAWVPWIHNNVTHMPRFDGTTLDSMYMSQDFMGDIAGKYSFANTAEPVSLWTQVDRRGLAAWSYRTSPGRHFLVNYNATNCNFYLTFQFAGRNLNQSGDDLLPLGGVYARYCEDMWDNQGASTVWEITGEDSDGDGLPDWWETYAQSNYGAADDLAWDTLVDYNGRQITAGEAYLRDLAKGSYVNQRGDAVVGITQYKQTYDENANGLPDWWERLYGIYGEEALADEDNDGLSNYTEYLLSEVFAFKGVSFSPVKANSADLYTPDYFYPVGSLYVGEIFTDHDLVDDDWEDDYATAYATRLEYDAFKDADNDGWCNRSENRYSRGCLPIVANCVSHTTAADGLIADYPIPTLALTVNYGGNRFSSVNGAPMVVKVSTDATLGREADAVFNIGATSQTTAGTGATSAASEKNYTRALGKWADRHVIGTLTPGNINASSLKFECCYDPSSENCSWQINASVLENSKDAVYSMTRRGTREEYAADVRSYGSQCVTLIETDPEYGEVLNLQLRTDEEGGTATWYETKTSTTLGTVNLTTGEFDMDLSVLKDIYVHNSTNENDYSAMVDQTFRIAYTVNESMGLPRKLYLGQADEGYVREGENTITVFADLDNNGEWTVGEPYGVATADISWKGTEIAVELTDTSAIVPRIDLVGDEADRTEDRAGLYDRLYDIATQVAGVNERALSNQVARLEYLKTQPITTAEVVNSATERQRIRVVRWLANGVPVYWGSTMRVVLDKYVETGVRGILTEADVLAEGVFDLDWDYLRTEVTDNSGLTGDCGNVTNVTYLVVVGEGAVGWETYRETNITVNALNTLITRHYGKTRVLPQPLTPGAAGNGIVLSANPTFTWSIDCPDLEGYTAFNIEVYDEDGETVWTSGLQKMPPKEADGTYRYSAPLYVGDLTAEGKVFENQATYTWAISTYNSKFSNDFWTDAEGEFYMNVQETGYEYGSAYTQVRYFGPKETWADAVVRVQAFTSPDFSGQPVAAGYVANPGDETNGLAVLGQKLTVDTANCVLLGLPRGTYYLRGFIDSNANGVCDDWESSGYFCRRDGSTADFLNPDALVFDTEVGFGDLAVIYLEDADTDQDGLPDGWEYAQYGALDTVGVELLSSVDGVGVVVNSELAGELEVLEDADVLAAGLAGRTLSMLRNAGTLALALGTDAAGYDSFAAAISAGISEDLVADGVTIAALALKDGKVTIAIAAETEIGGTDSILAPAVAKSQNGLEVTCNVFWKAALDDAAWTLVKSQQIAVGAGAVEIDTGLDAADGNGFFRVELSK